MAMRELRLGGDGGARSSLGSPIVGGSSNVLYALSFVVLDAYGTFLANAVGVATSTVLANELHRRRTFRAADGCRGSPLNGKAARSRCSAS